MTAKRTDASTGQLVDVDEPAKAVDPKAPPKMRIKVYSPFKVYFDEDGMSISATNATGPFDILPHHHKFLTLLNPGELAIGTLNGKIQRIRISGGLMHVKADKVTVFLDI